MGPELLAGSVMDCVDRSGSEVQAAVRIQLGVAGADGEIGIMIPRWSRRPQEVFVPPMACDSSDDRPRRVDPALQE